MTDTIVYDGAKIDESSQILLQILDDYNGKTDIRTLRRESDLEQSSQVHYRYENHLGDPAFDPDVDDDAAGLVLKTGTKEIAGQEMTVFRLTDDGKDFLAMHEDDVLDAVGAAKAVDTIRRMKEQMDEFERELETIEDDVEESVKNVYSTRLHRLRSRMEELEDDLEQVEKHEKDIKAIQEWNTEVSDILGDGLDGYDSIGELEDAIEKSFENVEDRVDVLYANQVEIAKTLSESGLDVTIYRDANQIDWDEIDKAVSEL